MPHNTALLNLLIQGGGARVGCFSTPLKAVGCAAGLAERG